MRPIRAIHVGGSAERRMRVLRLQQVGPTVHVVCNQNLVGDRVFELTGGFMLTARMWVLDDDSLLRLRKVSFKLGFVIAQWTPPARRPRPKRGPKPHPRQLGFSWNR
jgi:hypothetical protein